VAATLVGSAGALLGVFWAILYPNLNSLTIVFEALGISMGFPPGLWMISIIAFHDRRIEPGTAAWPATVAVLATLGEILMGLVFAAAAGPLGAPASVLAATLVSPWYLWSSASAMVALLLWIPLDPGRRVVLTGLAVSGAAAPWVLADPVLGAALMTGAMGATIGAFYWAATRAGPRPGSLSGVILGVFVAYLGMTGAGVAVAVSGGSVPALVAFGAVMTAVMLFELRYLLAEGLGGHGSDPAPIPAPRESPAVAASP
jgi:hypothetical protein